MRSACPIDEPAQGVTACGLSAVRSGRLACRRGGVPIAQGVTVRPVGVTACPGAERVPCRSTFTA